MLNKSGIAFVGFKVRYTALSRLAEVHNRQLGSTGSVIIPHWPFIRNFYTWALQSLALTHS